MLYSSETEFPPLIEQALLLALEGKEYPAFNRFLLQSREKIEESVHEIIESEILSPIECCLKDLYITLLTQLHECGLRHGYIKKFSITEYKDFAKELVKRHYTLFPRSIVIR